LDKESAYLCFVNTATPPVIQNMERGAEQRSARVEMINS